MAVYAVWTTDNLELYQSKRSAIEAAKSVLESAGYDSTRDDDIAILESWDPKKDKILQFEIDEGYDDPAILSVAVKTVKD